LSKHPINLGIRFLLELAALAAMAVWGWQKGEDWLRYVFAIGIPLAAAIIWGTFRVPKDPGNAPVAVAGAVRVSLELVFFGFSTWALANANHSTLAWAFAITIVLHYLASYERIIWLLSQSLH
jgi:hypothetical protein